MAGEPSVGWFPISAKVHFIEQVERMRNIIHFEYEGHSVFFNEEGWINATDIASKYGKKPAKWKELPSTKSYINLNSG